MYRIHWRIRLSECVTSLVIWFPSRRLVTQIVKQLPVLLNRRSALPGQRDGRVWLLTNELLFDL